MIIRRFISSLGALWLRAKGLKVKKGLVLYGRPITHLTEGGTITLGENCVLCSKSEANFAGVNHPVILALLRPRSERAVYSLPGHKAGFRIQGGGAA